MKQDIYLIVGTPGSGKTWCMKQLEKGFDVCHHDNEPLQGGFKGWGGEDGYVKEIAKRASTGSKPVLADTPFSLSKLKEPLEKQGFTVKPVFIIESPEVTSKRYYNREKRLIPQGHLTRIETYKARARELGAKTGTSEQILDYLRAESEQT